jgi:hypothetical protein
MQSPRFVFSLVFLLLLASLAFGQSDKSGIVKIGTVAVTVPAPEGTAEEYSKNSALKSYIDGGMEPGNAALAAYVPIELAKRYDAGGKFSPADLTFYADIFEPQSIANMDFTPDLFEGFAARIKQQFPDSIDVLTPAILSRLAEAGPTGKPTNLGNFNKTADTLSVAILISGQHGRNIVTVGTTLSYVMAKQRLLYLIVFKQIKKDTDLQALMDQTRKWTAAIVAANK